MLRERGKGRKRERELIKEDRCQALAGKGGGRRAEEGQDEVEGDGGEVKTTECRQGRNGRSGRVQGWRNRSKKLKMKNRR